MLGTFEVEGRTPVISEETAREIDLAVREIIRESFDIAKQILTRNRAMLDRCAIELLKEESLNESRLSRLTVGLS